MMTDDAIPADSHLIERLAAPIKEGRAQMSYARQLIRKDGGVIEAFTRQFNYPDRSELKTVADLKTRGIKAFFASDVCAAYSREWYERLGGFEKHTIFNEDMIYAGGLIKSGYAIASSKRHGNVSHCRRDDGKNPNLRRLAAFQPARGLQHGRQLVGAAVADGADLGHDGERYLGGLAAAQV